MLPEDKAIATPAELETILVEIGDINEGTEEDYFGNMFPYRFRFIDKDKNIISEEESDGVMRPKVWFKKFYVGKTGFINYTRNGCFLAILKLQHKEKNIDLGKTKLKVDVNKLIGYSFKAVVMEGKDGGGKFINWYETLKAAGVDVPTEGHQIPGQKEKEELEISESAVSETSKDDTKIDIDGLLF